MPTSENSHALGLRVPICCIDRRGRRAAGPSSRGCAVGLHSRGITPRASYPYQLTPLLRCDRQFQSHIDSLPGYWQYAWALQATPCNQFVPRSDRREPSVGRPARGVSEDVVPGGCGMQRSQHHLEGDASRLLVFVHEEQMLFSFVFSDITHTSMSVAGDSPMKR